MIHLSDIKKFDRCEKLYQLSQEQPQQFFPFVFYNENMISLCLDLLQITDYFNGQVGDDGQLALHALQKQSALINARFSYGELRIKVPIMVKTSDKWNIYFTFRSCYPKEREAVSMADTIAVLKRLQIPVKEVFAIHLNANYVREETLDVKQLLIINTHLFNQRNKEHKTIMELIERFERDVFAYIPKLQEALHQDIKPLRSSACTRGSKCAYFSTCFEEPESDTSVLHLVTSAKKYEMLQEGIDDIKDVDIDRIEGTRHQYAQIMAALHQGTYFDRIAVQTWVDACITYPISYLDFEWETYAYPPFTGMKPFDVLCFQYSLHIENNHGDSLIHKEYLGIQDCRIEFIERLLKDIPNKGSIMVFNMEGAEKLRLKQLGEQFPQYKKDLDVLCDRMVDLSLPFSSANIYDSRMRGLFSLKTLISVYSDNSYGDLDISYGMDAVRNWRLLGPQENEDSEDIRTKLLAYCAMDTYAEVIVYHAILDMLKK